MPVRIFVAEQFIFQYRENRRGEYHDANRPGRDYGGLISDLRIVGQRVPRRRWQDKADDNCADGGAQFTVAVPVTVKDAV